MKKYFNVNTVLIIIGFLGLFLLATSATWAAFTLVNKNKSSKTPTQQLSELESKRIKIEKLPQTEECPINGEKFSKVEREIWERRRPMAAIIENHLDSRPQSGLSRADVVYEVVAEGGITRFLGIFYCRAAKEDVTIGPLRSARVYLTSWASGYGANPLFVHFGGANNICGDCPGGVKPKGTVSKKVLALEQLINMGWRHSAGNALDGGANVSYPAIKRDQTRLGEVSAWEHSAVGSTDLLFNLGIDRGYGYEDEDGNAWDDTFTKWEFADDKPATSPTATDISFEFWSNKPDYDVQWKYDPGTNSYLRFNGGKPHTDWEFNKPQLSAKNIVIMFVKEEGPVDQEHHMFYKTVDSGEALFFNNGNVTEGNWEKADQFDRILFTNNSGENISFVRGPIWIEALPRGNEVNY